MLKPRVVGESVVGGQMGEGETVGGRWEKEKRWEKADVLGDRKTGASELQSGGWDSKVKDPSADARSVTIACIANYLSKGPEFSRR